MRSGRPARAPAPAWDIATPARPLRLPGVSMAGFRGGAADIADMSVVPYPAVTIFVDFGDGLLAEARASGTRQRGSVVTGLGPCVVFRNLGGAVECLQLRLSPVVAHAALGGCAGVSGTVASLDDLWGRDAGRFREQLRAAASWDERFAIAEAALGRRCAEERPVDPEVALAWGQMVGSRGGVRVEDVAAEAGWSRKRLWSRFRSQVGLTPKRAAQLVRFDRAAHRLAAGVSAALVAADGGYADQSHLHRDAMAFTGLTPKAVASASWLTVDPVAWAAPEYLART